MLHEAVVSVTLESRKKARAVAQGISPDNVPTPPGLRVETRLRGLAVVSRIVCEGRIETLLAALDDLLRCLQLSEKVLETQANPLR